MAKLQYRSISRRTVDGLSVEKDTVFWDRELAGFGVRVYPSGSRVYVVQTRGPGGPKRATVGRHGVITADQARRRAAAAIARIKAGEDPGLSPAPARKSPTVAEVASRYLREHVEVRCKPATVGHYRTVIDRHIVPALGGVPVAALTPRQVADLHYGLRERPYTANLAVDTLSQLIGQAMAWGLMAEGSNPCRQVQRYREGRRERFLTDVEFRRLGRVLDEMEAAGEASVHAIAAVRLLMLTGCRRNEVMTLRWEDVDLDAGELRLRDAKTGPRVVSLSPAAVEVLAAVPRVAGQSVGDRGPPSGAEAVVDIRALAAHPRAGGARRRPAPRPSAQLCEPRARAGREPARDRQAPRSCPAEERGALRAPWRRRGEGGRSARGRRHRRGHPARALRLGRRRRTGSLGRGPAEPAAVNIGQSVIVAGVGGWSRRARPRSPPGRSTRRRTRSR